jgi:DNA-binding NarL/FixJ family response regulator
VRAAEAGNLPTRAAETVKNHVRHLLPALGVKSRLEAVAAVHRS